jgi:hypothetical protein
MRREGFPSLVWSAVATVAPGLLILRHAVTGGVA